MHTHEPAERFGARARITICSGHAPIAQAFPQCIHEMPTRARRDQLGPRQFRGPFCFEHIAHLRHVHFIGTWQQFCAARHFATNRTAVRWRCVWTLGLSSPRAKGANFGLDLQGCRGLFLGDQSEGVLSITTSVSRALTLSVDLFIWQIMLVPERVENPTSAGEADAEYPCEVPHRLALNRDWPNSFPRSLPSLRRAAPGTRSKCKSARSGGRSASPAT